MASPKRPVASASANPRNAKGCTCACAAGLRATELISAENTLPMPIPAPTSAMQARPAPIILAEARSMCVFLCSRTRPICSMQMESVAQIETGEDGKHIGLERGHQQLQANQQNIDTQREDREQADAGGESAEDRQHRVSRQHVGEEPDRQREGADAIGQELDR